MKNGIHEIQPIGGATGVLLVPLGTDRFRTFTLSDQNPAYLRWDRATREIGFERVEGEEIVRAWRTAAWPPADRERR